MVIRDGQPGWRLVRLVVVTATVAGALALARGGPVRRGRVLATLGTLALAVGLGLAPYLVKDRGSVAAPAAVVLVATGLALVVGGTAVATRGRPRLRRVGAGFGALVATVLVAFVVGPSVAATNVPRPALGATPASFDLDHETVALRTADGVRLAAWYVPSTNRAAVVLLHGAGSTRSSVLPQAAVLAGNGYGVLLLDARGHGTSGGRAMDFGWYGDADVAAATGFLAHRADVDPARIGVVGLSMGGEEAIGASGGNPAIRAVVAEGATARTAADEAWLSDDFGLRGSFQEGLEWAQDRVTDLLTGASVPRSLRTAVVRSGATRYLLVTAGNVDDEGRAAAHLAAVDPVRVDVWTVPGADHTGGLATRPAEWERRVVAFLDDALAPA